MPFPFLPTPAHRTHRRRIALTRKLIRWHDEQNTFHDERLAPLTADTVRDWLFAAGHDVTTETAGRYLGAALAELHAVDGYRPAALTINARATA